VRTSAGRRVGRVLQRWPRERQRRRVEYIPVSTHQPQRVSCRVRWCVCGGACAYKSLRMREPSPPPNTSNLPVTLCAHQFRGQL
jgi:hypothetical protein